MILATLEVNHTGTTFMYDLLSTHLLISDRLDLNEFNKEVPWESPLQRGLQQKIESPITNRIKADIENRNPSYLKYTLFAPDLELIRLWFAFQPFEFKAIMPLRHPLSMLKTHIYGDQNGYLSFKRYLEAVYWLQNTDNFLFIPIDLLEKLEPEKRLKEMEFVFCDFLGLEMTEELKEKILSWERLGITPEEQKRELAPGEIKPLETAIKESSILDHLRFVGVDYAESIEDTQIAFSYSKTKIYEFTHRDIKAQ